MRSFFVGCLFLTTLLSSCYRASTKIEPQIALPMHPKEMQMQRATALSIPEGFSVSPFLPLTDEELATDWGKELGFALSLAAEFDLYRAITGFKRALWLLPLDKVGRRLEIEYDIALAYYLGKKYLDAIRTIEQGGLIAVDAGFAAYSDLQLVLYDSYKQAGQEVKAEKILCKIESRSPKTANKLSLLSKVEEANLLALAEEGESNAQCSYFRSICANYEKEAKSVRKAEALNAVLPGAGYWYVGQKESAVTAFLVNSLFVGAAAYFFDQGNIAAGLITLSLESGWYFGGIYGAGLAAKAYNEHLYGVYADKIIHREKLFPLMMLKYTF